MDEKRNDGRGYGDIGYKLRTESECCTIDPKTGDIRVKEGMNRISKKQISVDKLQVQVKASTLCQNHF